MPKVKTCRCEFKGMPFEGILNVNSKGVFSIENPDPDPESYPRKMEGMVAAELEKEWSQACRDIALKIAVERRVIAVRYDSIIRVNGKRSFFTDGDAMIVLEARCVIEITTTQGKKTTKTFSEPKEFMGLHSARQPFKWPFLMDIHDVNRQLEDTIFIEWTPTNEALMVRACDGIRAIATMLAEVLDTPESLAFAAERISFLPSLEPPQEIKKENGEPQ